ncbi:Rossmann-fold superfamily protein [Perilla frutescens var. hirtella]|uniref:Rossmann-fold superfamily protein n=1 Tax=Perilla frutescens var. hirtella TaxID=608512 RepID=A0AAD4IU20_PERFH|nr:Rossmann-fold superfamily protein [Perilla frutescens var. hirtella]
MAGSASPLSLSNSLSSLYCNRAFENVKPFPSSEKRHSFTCFSSKKKKLGFMDQILDYIEGGPKLRKWYGAPDLVEKDGNKLEEDEAQEEEEARDAVLVTDGDNEIGQMIILQLIVKRVRVKALVKDKRVAMEAFGAYVESMAGDTKEKSFLKKAFKGVRAVICPVEGSVYNIDGWKGIQHVILLSQLSVYRDSSGIQAVMNSNARKLAEEDESVVKASGVPYTIIRTGVLKNTPGGQQGFCFDEGSAAKGSLSKEDAAFICVEALENAPQSGFIFEVVNGAEKVSDWKKCFAALMERSTQQV